MALVRQGAEAASMAGCIRFTTSGLRARSRRPPWPCRGDGAAEPPSVHSRLSAPACAPEDSRVISFEQFQQHAADGHTLVPVVREVLSDLDTPLSVYLKPVSYTHLDVYKRQTQASSPR